MKDCNHTVSYIEKAANVVLRHTVSEVDCPHCLRREIDHLQEVVHWANKLVCDIPAGSNGWADLIRKAQVDHPPTYRGSGGEIGSIDPENSK